MKIAYQSNTGLTLLVNHEDRTYEYYTFGWNILINVGTNKKVFDLERELMKHGYKGVE